MNASSKCYSVSRHLPYRYLNLKRNPFGVPVEQERPELAVANVDEWVEQLLKERVAIQLVGDHGRGKSSHLFALKKGLEQRTQTQVPYLRLRDTRKILLAPTVLLDEGAQLPFCRWWTLRHVHSLAVSTHLNLRPLLWALGFRVITVRIEQRDPQRLQNIFQRRIEWARDASGPIPHITKETIRELQIRYGDDIRSMEHALYCSIEEMKEVGCVRLLT